jgi:hypothetical protein
MAAAALLAGHGHVASVAAVSSDAEQVRMPRQRRSSVAIGDGERDKMEEPEEARYKG